MIFRGAFRGGLSERKKIQSGVWCAMEVRFRGGHNSGVSVLSLKCESMASKVQTKVRLLTLTPQFLLCLGLGSVIVNVNAGPE